jgi:hypothetical protein
MCAFFSFFLSHPSSSSHWATVSYIADFSCSLQGPLCLPGLILIVELFSQHSGLFCMLYFQQGLNLNQFCLLLSWPSWWYLNLPISCLVVLAYKHIFGWIQWASSQCPVWSYPNWAWQLYFTEGTVSSNSTQIFLYPSIMCTFRNDSKHLWILKQAIVKVSAWSKRERSPA